MPFKKLNAQTKNAKRKNVPSVVSLPTAKQKTVKLSEEYVHEYFQIKKEWHVAFSPSPDGMASLSFPCDVRGCMTDNTGNRFIDYAIELGNEDALVKQVEEFINEKKYDDLFKELEKDFFIELLEERPAYDHFHLDSPGERQGARNIRKATYTYRSNFEQLAVMGKLPLLLGKSVHPELRKRTLAELKQIELAAGDDIDFSDLDLSGACFVGAKLGRSDFQTAKLDRADFSEADLTNCMIKGSNLDGCLYSKAHLPAGVFPYWKRPFGKLLYARLDQLKNYVTDQISGNDPKYDQVIALFQEYGKKLNPPDNLPFQFSNADKENLLADLKQAENIFSTHRNLKLLVCEVIAIVLTGVVGYVAAAAVKYAHTGRFGLFADETNSQRKAREIRALMEPATTTSSVQNKFNCRRASSDKRL